MVNDNLRKDQTAPVRSEQTRLVKNTHARPFHSIPLSKCSKPNLRALLGEDKRETLLRGEICQRLKNVVRTPLRYAHQLIPTPPQSQCCEQPSAASKPLPRPVWT